MHSVMATSKSELLTLLEDIKGWQVPKLRLAATSRPDLDIEQRIGPLCTGHISLQEEELEIDIKTYVEDHLVQNLAFRKFPAPILADIKRVLVSQSHGMLVKLARLSLDMTTDQKLGFVG